MKSLLPITAILCFCTAPVQALEAAASSSHLDIQVVQNLYFGGLLVSEGGGSVTLTPDGSLIPLGQGIQAGAYPPSTEARFRLSGPPNTPFTLEINPLLPVLTGLRGERLRIAELRPSLPGLRGTFDRSGQAEFRLGGRLDIPANVSPALFVASQVRLDLSIAGGPEPKRVSSIFAISTLLRAPLKLTNLGPLDFGALIPGTASGDFEVSADGSYRSLSPNGPTHLKSYPHPAPFSIQGPAGACFTIRLPQQAILSGPGSQMRVHGFTCDIPAHGTLPPGDLNFNVGARITVDPNQAYGLYRGTFTVKVDYQ